MPVRHARRLPRALAGALLVISSMLSLLAGGSRPASAETPPPLPVTVTATPTTGLVDGTTVNIHVDAQSPPNAAASQIFGVEARICDAAASIDYSADFNPGQTGHCALSPLSVNSDAFRQVATAPPNLTADLSFRVGIGSNSYTSTFGGPVTITCGPLNPCKLVVKLQVPSAIDFMSFPLSYVGTPSGDLFHSLSPTRILDSRPPPEKVGDFGSAWTAGLSRDVQVIGRGGVPTGADAVALNATVTGTTAASFLTVWPTGSARPTASNINWSAGQTIPNAVTVKLGTGGMVSVFNNSGDANVIFDLVGYYDGVAGTGFTSLTPARVLDSRPPPEKVGAFDTPWSAGLSRDVQVTGVGAVPSSADAVVLNSTVTGTTAASFLTIWPTGTTKPTASSLNWSAGQTIPNAVTVKLGTGGKVSVFNNSGYANVIMDVVGYFESATGSRFHPLAPARVQDSRPPPEKVGAYSTPWGAGASRSVAVAGVGGVPATGAVAVLTNFTATGTTADSFATVWPTDATRPTASSLNWSNGVTIANAVTAKLAADGSISVFNNSGTVDLIADVAGWYGT